MGGLVFGGMIQVASAAMPSTNASSTRTPPLLQAPPAEEPKEPPLQHPSALAATASDTQSFSRRLAINLCDAPAPLVAGRESSAEAGSGDGA